MYWWNSNGSSVLTYSGDEESGIEDRESEVEGNGKSGVGSDKASAYVELWTDLNATRFSFLPLTVPPF